MSVSAATPVCKIGQTTYDSLTDAISAAADGAVIEVIANTTLSSKVTLTKKIEITSKRTTREKLMTYLMFQAKKAGSSRFEIPFDRQELADYLEVDRSGLSAEIGKLKKEGILSSEKNRFELL